MAKPKQWMSLDEAIHQVMRSMNYTREEAFEHLRKACAEGKISARAAGFEDAATGLPLTYEEARQRMGPARGACK